MMPMVDGQCDEPSRAALRRRRITDAARKLFVANGFHATGMAQLARESGVAVGQIYRDFHSKEEIVAALVETNCSALMMYEQLDAALRDHDSATSRSWLREFMDPGDCGDNSKLFAEIIAESSRNERIAAIFHMVHDGLRQRILATLELLAPGADKEPRRVVMTEVLMIMSLGLFQYGLMSPEREVAPVLDAITRLVDRELAALAGA